MKPQALDTYITSGYVTPDLCKELYMAGVTDESTHQWKIYQNSIVLHTKLFDIDDYYKDGDKVIDAINPPEIIIAAYSLKEMEQCIPEYLLSKNSFDLYELALVKTYDFPGVSGYRLPDLFARMLLQLIRNKAIDVDKLNKLICPEQ